MAFSVRRTEYFNATLSGEPGEAYEVLSQLAGLGISNRVQPTDEPA